MKIALTALAGSLLVSCGAPTARARGPERDLDAPTAVASRAVEPPGTPFVRLDPMVDLTIDDDAWEGEKLSWVRPGRAALEIDGAPIDSGLSNAAPIPTTILDRSGNKVRLAVRLDQARFSLWVDRSQLLGIIRREVQLAQVFPGADQVYARLRPGAVAERVEKRPQQTKVRYIADVEMEGWVPDAAIGDTGGERTGWHGYTPTGLPQISVMRGAEIYAEPRWGSTRLAVVNRGFQLDRVKVLEDNWMNVVWTTVDAEVAGYYRQFSPPGRYHSQSIDPDVAPVPISPNMRVASGTCLHARASGEPIGFLVGDQDVQIDPTSDAEWPSLAIDTPWGAILFRAHGHDATDFATCAPSNANVPPSAINVAPPAP